MNDCCPWLGKTVFQPPANSGSQCIIEVGDGVRSSGHFNEPHAIRDALEFAKLNNAIAVHIVVLTGIYQITGPADVIDISTFQSVTIEACNPFTSIILNNTHDRSTVTSNGEPVVLTLSGLIMVPGFNSGVVKPIVDVSGVAFIKECVIAGGLRLLLSNTFSVEGVTESLLIESSDILSLNGAPSGDDPPTFFETGPAIELVPSQGDVSGGVLVRNSNLAGGMDVAAVLVRPAGTLAGGAELSPIRFENCNIRLQSISTSPLSNTNNPGAFKIDMNGNEAGQLFLREVSWDDCDVFANGGLLGTSPGDASVLLYLRPGASDGTSAGIGTVTIRGGRWAANAAVPTDFAPFYIGPSTLTDDTGESPIEQIVIENVRMGFDNEDTGFGEPDPQTHGGPAPEVSSVTADRWAAFTIVAEQIAIRDIKFIALAAKSNSGDLQIVTFTAGTAKIDGVTALNYTDGADGADPPKYRVRLDARSESVISASDVHIVNIETENQLVEDDWGAILVCGFSGFINLMRCRVFGLQSFTSMHGFTVFGQDHSDSVTVSFKLCVAFGVSGSGFHYRPQGVEEDVPLQELRIEECTATQNGESGIVLVADPGVAAIPFRNFVLRGNSCTQNEDAGIFIAPNTWVTEGNDGPVVAAPIVTENVCTENPVGIKIGQASVDGPIAIIVRNNDCTEDDDGFDGTIELIASTSPPVPSPISLTSPPFGLHTGLQTTAAGPGAAIEKVHVDGDPMVENIGVLLNI